MTPNPPEMETEMVDAAKANAVLQLIVMTTLGPREGYAVLCAAIWALNFKMSDEPVSIDELVAEVGMSLRSITDNQRAN